MTTWEEIPDSKKTLSKCKQFFENAYIARKQYIGTKEQKQENVNKIAKADLHMYLAAKQQKKEW